MNSKLIEFIIVNQDFYNSLTEHYKEMISDLDFYVSNIYENSSIEECYNTSSKDPLVTTDFIYFYIGNKNTNKYYLRMIYSYYNNVYYFNINSAQLIIKKDTLNFINKRFIYE